MKFCTKVNLSVKATDNTGNILIYRPRCKQWDCPYCAIQNAKIWRARIMLEIQKSAIEIWHFWTLTLDGCDHDGNTANSLWKWRESWDSLMKRIKRDLGKLRYIRIFEPHKDGTLHVHMLTDKTYADVARVEEDDGRDNYRSKELEKHLTDLSLGWRHDVRPIHTKDKIDDGVARNVSAYVTKYLSKDLQSLTRQVLKDAGMSRVRMIQTSQNWYNEKQVIDKPLIWELQPLYKFEYESLPSSLSARDITRDRKISIDDFYDSEYYPNKISDLIDANPDK